MKRKLTNFQQYVQIFLSDSDYVRAMIFENYLKIHMLSISYKQKNKLNKISQNSKHVNCEFYGA